MTEAIVHLFLNPTAGRGRAGRRQARILQHLESTGLDVRLHLSRAVGDLEAQVLEQVRAGARRIVVAGGDGSIHEATNGIMQSGEPAALGVVPTGTGNDFAKACGIPLDWEQATRLLANRLADGAVTRGIDVGRMNERFFANGAGIGLDAEVTRIASSYRLPIGDFVYLLAIFRAMLRGIATPAMHITGGARSWRGPVTFANIANGPWIGGMFHVAPMAANDDGHFDLLVVDPVTRRRIVRLLPRILDATHMPEPEIHHEPVVSVTIEAQEPVASHLDGELQPMQTHFEIEILPGALRLL